MVKVTWISCRIEINKLYTIQIQIYFMRFIQTKVYMYQLGTKNSQLIVSTTYIFE